QRGSSEAAFRRPNGNPRRLNQNSTRISGRVRGVSKGSKREVQPGVWELRVGAGRDPVTGRYLNAQERVRGTELQAERRLRDIVKTVDRAHDVGPSTMTTVRDLLDAWWPVAKPNLSPSTVKNQTALIESIIKPRIGAIPLARLDTAAIDRFYALLSA